MTFSIYSFLFAAIVLLFFHIMIPGWRIYLLAAASMVYAYTLSPTAAFTILAVTILSYVVSIAVEFLLKKEKNKCAVVLTGVAIALCILSLLVLKNAVFLNGRVPDKFISYLIIPIGFSYYIFQTIGYLCDVYEKKIPAEKNPVSLLLFLAWFPKLTSGPIERKGNFSQQIQNIKNVRLFEKERWLNSVSYIVFGCFYKMMIADRIAPYADALFDKPNAYGSLWLIFGSLGYTVQIYCDFAGYTMMAIGVSLLFGIELSPNFHSPYCSQNITEFWRRWHMSLSFFLRDYLYIPLGGNRKGKLRKIINTLIVFIVCGMWHGAGLSFVFWGLLHGIYSTFDALIKKKGTFLRSGSPGRVITFICVSTAWIFFKASSLRSGLTYITSIFTNIPMIKNNASDMAAMGINATEIWILVFAVIVMIVIDIYMYRKNDDIAHLSMKWSFEKRLIIFVLMAVAILIFGKYGPDTSGELIYMQF
ncbi:MAG: hypothetical protein K6A38_04355 [Lachnospiraceae bacterium]|nr:hypothetical protein [Lachnospiraceae bacterium]